MEPTSQYSGTLIDDLTAAVKRCEPKPSVERHERPTIMDGRVVDFCTSFCVEDRVFGPHYTPYGPFHISASRNAVMVHGCTLKSDEDFNAFVVALAQAQREYESMKAVQQ